MCQDRACQVCPAVPAGGPNSTLSPLETCLECVGGLEQDPDSGVCHQGLGGGLEGSAPPVTCPYGTYPAPNGKCVRVSGASGSAREAGRPASLKKMRACWARGRCLPGRESRRWRGSSQTTCRGSGLPKGVITGGAEPTGLASWG